jgi:hypothetical protein
MLTMAINLNDSIVAHDNSTPPNGTKHGVKISSSKFYILFIYIYISIPVML